MKILIIHSSPWNDKISNNNVLTNWFEGFDADFANLYRGNEKPCNNICNNYFQITDKDIIDSFFGKPAGKILKDTNFKNKENNTKNRKQLLKKFSCEFLGLIRSSLWLCGKINVNELKKWIDDFNPDVVFTCRKASFATLRLERIVHSMTKAPFVAFTGDDEYSLNQFRFDPFFWIERFFLRSYLRKNAKFYNYYLTLSEDQADLYKKYFNIKTDILRKCYEIDETKKQKKIIEPYKIVYTGKLYCNRWKTIGKLSQSIKNINNKYGREIFNLDVYALGNVSKKEKEYIECSKYTKIKEPVPSNKLKEIFDSSDIVLHVESFDLKNKLDTRFSFSTKIIDCLASGCAVMAIAWKNQTGLKYLKNQDAAICIVDLNDIENELDNLVNNSGIIKEYSQKAKKCLIKNHEKSIIQNHILDIFLKIKSK